MSPAEELQTAIRKLRSRAGRRTRYAAPLADLLADIATITPESMREPYAGTWQGRGLAVARAINNTTRRDDTAGTAP